MCLPFPVQHCLALIFYFCSPEKNKNTVIKHLVFACVNTQSLKMVSHHKRFEALDNRSEEVQQTGSLNGKLNKCCY